MARPRTTNAYLPKYVTVIHGAYWYRPPDAKSVRIAAEGDLAGLYKFMAKLTAPEGPITRMSEVFDRYIREVVPTLAERTQKDYLRHLSILRAWCGHMHPDELEPKDIGKFLDVEKGKIQRNRQVAVLSAVYAKAVGRWYVAQKNPCRDVERNPTHRRTRYVTDEEYLAVYTLASERTRLMMDLALITGQRQGDLIALKWEAVTDSGIRLQQGKTGKKLIITKSEVLEAVLERAKALKPDLPREYVVRTRKGRPYTSEGFRAVWQRTMNQAMRKKVIQERFTFHDLRAKSVSDSETLEQAFERAGHTSMSMTRGVYDRNFRKVTPLK